MAYALLLKSFIRIAGGADVFPVEAGYHFKSTAYRTFFKFA